MSDNMPAVNGTNGHGSVQPLDGVSTLGVPVGTDFKAVAIGPGPNIEAFPAYFNDPLLQTGNLPGIAISAFNNRALRQGTFVASSLCLWISGQINQYIADDGDQIHWQSEWQNALSNFVSSLIPGTPDYTGVFLPILGGQMKGNITFDPNITTVLANNVFYQARDASGQARGLIVKNSNNDITVNDGTAPHVIIANQPVANNNYAWSGRNTTGTILPVIGLMSDNNIHIGGSSTTDIYLDITSAVHHAGNVILNNNRNVYGLDTGGTARQLIGVGTDNAAYVASGVLGNTNIYAGSGNWIYLRQNTNALAQMTVNGFTYMNGRGRAYAPGGNDPFQVYADNGFYARARFLVGGTREWSAGCLNNGPFGIADESAGAMRFQIDTGGTATFFNTCNINGSSTIGGNLAVNGQINVGSNIYFQAGYAYNTFSVWNSLWVNSGNINAGGGTVYCGGVNTGGPVQGGWLYSTGDAQVNGSQTVNGNLQVNNNINCNTFSTNHISDNGDLTMNGNFWTAGNVGVNNHLAVQNGFCMGAGGAYNFDYTLGFPVANHAQWAGGLGVFAQFFGSYSDERLKRNIVDVDHDALTAIKPLRFYSYDVPRRTPDEEIIDERSHVAYGFMAQQMQETLPGVVRETALPVTFVMDHPETGAAGCHFETEPVLAIDMMTLLAYSLRAIQQLTSRLETLEHGGKPGA